MIKNLLLAILPVIALAIYSGSREASSVQNGDGDPCDRYGKRFHDLNDTTLFQAVLKDVFTDAQSGKESLVEQKLDCAQSILNELFPQKGNKFWAYYYSNKGSAMINLEKYNEALEPLQAALAIYNKLDTGFERDKSFVNSNLGVVYNNKGELNKSIQYSMKRLDYLLKHEGKDSCGIARMYTNIANSYLLSEQFDEAEKLYKLSLVYCSSSLLVRSYANEGIDNVKVFRDKNTEQIIDSLTKRISQNADIAGKEAYQQDIRMAFYSLQVKRYSDAISYSRKGINTHRTYVNNSEPDNDLAYLYANMAIAYYYTDRFDKYEQYTDSSFWHFKYFSHGIDYVSDFIGFANVLHQATGLYSDHFDKKGDINDLHKANIMLGINLEFTEKARKSMNVEDMMSWNQYREIFVNQGIRIKSKLNKLTGDGRFLEECLQLSELSKMPGLNELKWTRNAYTGMQETNKEYKRLQALRKELLGNRIEIQKLVRHGGKTEDTSFISLNVRGYQIEDEISRMEGKLFKTSGAAKLYTRQDYTRISLKKIQDMLRLQEQSMVEYKLADSVLYIFAITPDTLVLHTVRDVSTLPDKIESITRHLNTKSEMDESLSFELYKTLFAPVEPVLKKYKRLLVIPDRQLSYLPFNCLMVAKPGGKNAKKEYLIDRYAIQTNYSAQLQSEMILNSGGKKTGGKRFLGVAPEYKLYMPTGNDTIDRRNSILGPLKYSAAEVLDIGKIIPGDILTGEEASKSSVIRKADEYSILHFAMHGVADDASGDLSFLSFWRDSEDEPESAYNLYNKELYDLKLTSDMVVLSACETGLGQYIRGEGIISMARGFSFAGAKSVLMTLWSIDDKATMTIMTDFYRNLKKGLRKDESLRLAQLAYLEKNTGASPYYWASFIPMGDMSPIDLTDGVSWWWAVLAVGALIVLAIVLYKKGLFR